MIKITAGTLILGLLFLQSQSAARKSDRELDGFVGPVKKSFIEWSPVSGYPYPPDSRCRRHTSVYDPDGRMIQSSVYPGNCGSDEIRELYTYDQEGNRISHTEEIRGKNSPPPPPPPMPEPGAKKDEGVKGPPKTTFKFDVQGALTERSTFRASGTLIYKIIYTYDAKGRLQQTQTVYPEGKIGDKRVYSYEGEKHFPEGYSYIDANDKLRFKVSYSEYEFNPQGDWIKRRETTTSPSSPTTISINYQTLEYHPAMAEPPSEKIELMGTVTAIFPIAAKPPSLRNWAVTIRVEKVKVGKFSRPEFTFTVHSPSNAGLKVGGRCTIEATWTGQGYLVSDTRWMGDKDTVR